MSEKTGTIYDIGYKRYLGTRRPPSTRWLVIMRHQIAMGWKKWWRYKLALFLAVVTSFIAGGFMYFATNKLIRSFGARASEVALTMADGVVPLSIQWYCRAAFILTLTLGATIVATDTQSGAFTFYFVRSIRPIDYVIGKLVGFGLLVATIVLGPPLLLAAFRLGLSDNTEQLVSLLHIVPKVLLIGTLATLVYTAVPLAISAVVANRRYALALWAAHYLIVGNIASLLAAAGTSELAVFDLNSTIQAITYDLFDIRALRGGAPTLSTSTAIVGLVAQAAAALTIVWYQVSRDQKTGVGGSS